MRLRPESQCALRILVALAKEPDPVDVTTLVMRTKAASPLVLRTLEALSRTRMVRLVRRGHYCIGFHPRAIYIADVLDATGALDESLTCPLASPQCTPDTPCELCWTLFEADVAAIQAMRSKTLNDLVHIPYKRAVPRGADAMSRSA